MSDDLEFAAPDYALVVDRFNGRDIGPDAYQPELARGKFGKRLEERVGLRQHGHVQPVWVSGLFEQFARFCAFRVLVTVAGQCQDIAFVEPPRPAGRQDGAGVTWAKGEVGVGPGKSEVDGLPDTWVVERSVVQVQWEKLHHTSWHKAGHRGKVIVITTNFWKSSNLICP